MKGYNESANAGLFEHPAIPQSSRTHTQAHSYMTTEQETGNRKCTVTTKEVSVSLLFLTVLPSLDNTARGLYCN